MIEIIHRLAVWLMYRGNISRELVTIVLRADPMTIIHIQDLIRQEVSGFESCDQIGLEFTIFGVKIILEPHSAWTKAHYGPEFGRGGDPIGGY